jgi:hypothetical protein
MNDELDPTTAADVTASAQRVGQALNDRFAALEARLEKLEKQVGPPAHMRRL